MLTKGTTEPDVKFFLIGDEFSGIRDLAITLSECPSVYCHPYPLHDDSIKRMDSHIGYFGEDASSRPGPPEWFDPREESPARYLRRVLNGAAHNEKSIGACLYYEHIVKYDLFEFIEEFCTRDGGVILHLFDNPLSCFAKMTVERGIDHYLGSQFPVHVETDKAEKYIDTFESVRRKIDNIDCKFVRTTYTDLCNDYDETMSMIVSTIDQQDTQYPEKPEPFSYLPMSSLISNLPELEQCRGSIKTAIHEAHVDVY